MQMQAIEAHIWNYIDGIANAREIIFVEQMIVTDKLWQQKYEELSELNQLLTTVIETDQPSLRFSKNVMEQIRDTQPLPATIHYVNKNIIRSIAAIFIFTMVAFLAYSFVQINWSSPVGSSLISFDIKTSYLNKLDFGKLATSKWVNIVLMINVVLGLVLLDSMQRRRKKINQIL
jgi:hypothetical protein